VSFDWVTGAGCHHQPPKPSVRSATTNHQVLEIKKALEKQNKIPRKSFSLSRKGRKKRSFY
jgi:hypothetical protein